MSALTGVRVVDFSRALAGPLATMLLADLGADVVKVERPGAGDESRAWGPFADGESTYFMSVNRNKRSLALDLDDETQLAAARRLVSVADVVVQNYRPGAMERRGLGYADTAAANPGVVYCSISAFGTGPGTDLPGYDFLLQALSGIMSVTGTPDSGPLKAGVPVVDVVTGLFATIGILGALCARSASGPGQHVEVDLMSSALAGMGNAAAAFLTTGVVPLRLGNAHPGVAPYELFPAADGDIAIAVANDAQFGALCRELGRPGLAADARFTGNRARVENRAALRRELSAGLRGAGASEWLRRLQACGVPCGRVNDVREAFALAEELGLAPGFSLPRADGTAVAQVRNPLRLSRTPVTYRQAPPALGEHTEELLDALGAGEATWPPPAPER